MNDWLTSDPRCFNSAAELKLFLSLLGPLTGRYHLSLPRSWRREILERFEQIGQQEKKKAEFLLQQAAFNTALHEVGLGRWDESKSWIKNTEAFHEFNPELLKAAIVEELPESASTSCPFRTLEDYDISPTEEESIRALPSEYVRVSEIFLTRRQELYFIDPYLDIKNPDVFKVLRAMFEIIERGKCQQLIMYARHAHVLKNGQSNTELEQKFQQLVQMLKGKCSVTYKLVDDRRDRMHARYLLSVKGGIRLEQGFQSLRNGRRVEIAPIGRIVLDELITRFIEGKNKMKVQWYRSN